MSDGIDNIQELLRGEISAVETYRQALEKVDDQLEAADLRRLESEHQEAVNRLSEAVSRLGATPETDSGGWGAFARAVEGTSKVFGNRAALEALKKGEEHGLSDYREALDDRATDPEVNRLIRGTLIPRQEEHIVTLDRLMEAS
ncbi:MAG: DUF2383 domain-containing protein [Longimicrobiaceae bacterium]